MPRGWKHARIHCPISITFGPPCLYRPCQLCSLAEQLARARQCHITVQQAAGHLTSTPRRITTVPLHSVTPASLSTEEARLAGQLIALGSLLLAGSRHTSTPSSCWLLQQDCIGEARDEFSGSGTPRHPAAAGCCRSLRRGTPQTQPLFAVTAL